MTAYLVRNARTKGILGLFVSPNFDDLQWDIDEVGGDPGDYEYRVVRHGAIAFYGAREPVYDIDRASDGTSLVWRLRRQAFSWLCRAGLRSFGNRIAPLPVERHDFWNGACESDGLVEALLADRWKPLPYAIEADGIVGAIVAGRA